jgi:pimeloyl-ACP methyl ester carboxylesterase
MRIAMSIVQLSRFAGLGRDLVIALHCSGANASQWLRLASALGNAYEFIVPEHYGCDGADPWTGQHAFGLADEAARTIALIDATDRKVHLVGHSYGGGVALHVALARPDCVASLSLYEPSAFHLLPQTELGERPLKEIRETAYVIAMEIVAGDYHAAAKTFVDYWNGAGSFGAMRPLMRDALARWMRTAPLNFSALFAETTPAANYRILRAPVLTMRGEHAPPPTRIIAGMMPSLFANADLKVIAGAGHMGPLTHSIEVNDLIVQHVAKAKSALKRAA